MAWGCLGDDRFRGPKNKASTGCGGDKGEEAIGEDGMVEIRGQESFVGCMVVACVALVLPCPAAGMPYNVSPRHEHDTP